MKKLLLAMAIGAGLAWFFDPENGSGRRDALRKKLEGSGLSGSSSMSSTADLPMSTPVRSTATTNPPIASIP